MNPAGSSAFGDTARVVALEEAFDRLLPAIELDGPVSRDLLKAGRDWSDAVWAAAAAAPPITLEGSRIEEGLAMARRPVFICGVHRSGTTLVRDLLDAHPSLTVLPAEGSFFTDTAPQLARLDRRDHLRCIGGEWLRRLANPINRPPYWLLGRTTADDAPYAAFARALMEWWPIVDRDAGRERSLRPLVAVVLAYACRTAPGSSGPRARRWVEKTPTNERFLERLWGEFPGGKVVHLIRDPLAVFASRKRLEEQATGRFERADQVLAQLAESYRIALDRAADERCLIIRYEELVENAPASIARLAGFLDIEPLPILMQPTVAGRPASNNSAFGPVERRGVIARQPAQAGDDHRLTRPERARVVAATAELALRLGYTVPFTEG